MARDNATNPWGDAANQAVGALYKYYMSQPTAADALKQKYMQAQMDRIGVQNEMDTRQMDLGNYALPNLSPEIRNIMYRDANPQSAQLFDAYVRPPMQVDTGDAWIALHQIFKRIGKTMAISGNASSCIVVQVQHGVVVTLCQ